LIKLCKAADYKSYLGIEKKIELGNEIDYDIILKLISD